MSRLTCLLLVAALVWGFGRVRAAGAPPNIVIILVDDLGWTDLGVYGSRFHHTPNLDRLAGEGLRFTDAYSACTVCSPTQAVVLTGKHPARLHFTDGVPGDTRPKARLKPPAWSQGMDPGEPNLARQLKAAGYATAIIGLLTDREGLEAIAFMEANRSRPFFLFLADHAVHPPITGKPAVTARYRAEADPWSGQHDAEYAALLESVDDSVGRIRSRLGESGIASNTVIVFTSDNGGLVLGGDRAPTSNWPLRSGKGDCTKGGSVSL